MKSYLAITLLIASTTVVLALATQTVLLQFKPEVELRRMIAAMAEIETVRESTAISWTRQLEQGSVTTTLYTKGQIFVDDSGAIEHGTSFRVGEVAEAGFETDLSGEVRQLDGTVYLSYESPGPNVPGLIFEEGKWMAIDAGKFFAWGSVLPGIHLPLLKQTEKGAWSDDARLAFREYLRRADIFSIIHVEKETQRIGDVETRVFDVKIPREAAGAFLRDIIRHRDLREPTDEERLETEAQAEALANLSLRLWIGAEDHRVYRLQAAGLVEEQDDLPLTSVNILVHFKDYNAPFEVAIPENIQNKGLKLPNAAEAEDGSFKTGVLFDESRGTLPKIVEEKRSDADNDGLSNLMEAFYGTNSQDADTDDDGKTDGEEVLAGQNPRGSGSLFGFGLGD